MADTSTGLPVQSLSGQFVNAKIYDTGGTNVAAVSAGGALSANITTVAGAALALGQGTMAASLPVAIASNQTNLPVNLAQVLGAAHSVTNPVFVELTTGAAAYTLFGQTGATAPFTRITDATTTVGVIAGTTALKTDLSSIAGTAPGATSFVPVRLTDGAAYYTKMGQTIATSPFTIITDGTTQVGVKTVTGGALSVAIVDGTGTQITSFGGGTQYVGDAVATSTPTGTMSMGLAHAAAPSDVSADNDAVAMWMLRNGSPVMNIASGGTLLTNIGQAAATSTFVRINDGTTTAGVIVGTTALKVDVSSIAGTAPGATVPLPVRLTDGAAFYNSASSAPTSPHYTTQTSAALGAGASATVAHYVSSGKTGRLAGVDVASTVPIKVVINTVVTGTPTARVVLFAPPFAGLQWRAPFSTYITQASSDGTTGFSVTFTNKDAATAADVYSTAFWDEV